MPVAFMSSVALLIQSLFEQGQWDARPVHQPAVIID